jgi:hypothetical protein
MSFISGNMKPVRCNVIVNRKNTIQAFRVVTHAAIVFVVLAAPDSASAYVDPGTTGMLAQILYVLFYGAVGMFFYYLPSVKEHMTNAKQFLGRLFARRE